MTEFTPRQVVVVTVLTPGSASAGESLPGPPRRRARAGSVPLTQTQESPTAPNLPELRHASARMIMTGRTRAVQGGTGESESVTRDRRRRPDGASAWPHLLCNSRSDEKREKCN